MALLRVAASFGGRSVGKAAKRRLHFPPAYCPLSTVTTTPHIPKSNPTADVTVPMRLSGSGSISMTLPLPSVKGLTPINLPAGATVKTLKEKLLQLDGSIHSVVVNNAMDHRMANGTCLTDAGIKEMLISVGETRMRVLNEERLEDSAFVVPSKYAPFKQRVVDMGKLKLSQNEYEALCTEMGADPILMERWLSALMSEGLATVVEQGLGNSSSMFGGGSALEGEDNSSRVVLLNPAGEGFTAEMASLLHEDKLNVETRLGILRSDLARWEEEEKALVERREAVVAKANRNATIKKGGVLVFMTGQFGILFHYVYGVYSWDVMEPASYFLMLTYTVGSSLYFSIKRRNATYDNLQRAALDNTERQLAPQHGYCSQRHTQLQAKKEKYQEAIELLEARLGVQQKLL